MLSSTTGHRQLDKCVVSKRGRLRQRSAYRDDDCLTPVLKRSISPLIAWGVFADDCQRSRRHQQNGDVDRICSQIIQASEIYRGRAIKFLMCHLRTSMANMRHRGFSPLSPSMELHHRRLIMMARWPYHHSSAPLLVLYQFQRLASISCRSTHPLYPCHGPQVGRLPTMTSNISL